MQIRKPSPKVIPMERRKAQLKDLLKELSSGRLKATRKVSLMERLMERRKARSRGQLKDLLMGLLKESRRA
jgi:hypothetical protein